MFGIVRQKYEHKLFKKKSESNLGTCVASCEMNCLLSYE